MDMRTAPLIPALLSLFAAGLVLAGPAEAATPPPSKFARRYVAVRANSTMACPARTGFTVRNLFNVKKMVEQKDPMAAYLGRFCVYTRIPSNGKGALALGAEFIRVDPDLDIVLPQGDTKTDGQVSEALADAYRASLGAFTLDAPKPPAKLPRVAIIDTAAASTDSSVSAEHGLAMASIATLAGCGKRVGCRRNTLLYQAFPVRSGESAPWLRPALDVTNSGLGSLATIAQAIEAATEKRGQDPLVINLSLGWDPQIFEETELLRTMVPTGQVLKPARRVAGYHARLLDAPVAEIPAPVQAAHAALIAASCRGALIIAAAGNNRSGACAETGPLEPAAWEVLPAPSPRDCAELSGATGSSLNESDSPGPLVYAAGGIMPSDAPLPISRVGGTPARVLPAFMAVVGKTDPWTGTSVAAAALSGLAAAVWAHLPHMDGHQVMAWLDGTGAPTKLTVDFGPKAGSKSVRISGRQALVGLCKEYKKMMMGEVPAACLQLPDTDAYDLASVVVDSAYAAISAATPDLAVGGGVSLASAGRSACGRRVTARTYQGKAIKPFPSEIVAPLAEVPVASPWARPQPETPICSSCPIRGGKLTISLDPDHKENLLKSGEKVRLTRPTLEFLVSAVGYVRVTLPDLDVGDDGLEVDLEPYSVILPSKMPEMEVKAVKLVDVLKAPTLEAGTLSVQVKDAAGNPTTIMSAVPVVH